MPVKQFTYKGKSISIDEKDEKATISIDSKYEFQCHFLFRNVPMWTCPGSYSMSPDTVGLAKHVVNNLDIITAPSTAPIKGVKVLDEGSRKRGATSKTSRKSRSKSTRAN